MGISAYNAVSPNASGRSQPGLSPGTPVRRCGSGSVSPRGSVGGLRRHPGRVPARAARGNPGIPGGGSPRTPERVLGRQTQTLVFRVKYQVLQYLNSHNAPGRGVPVVRTLVGAEKSLTKHVKRKKALFSFSKKMAFFSVSGPPAYVIEAAGGRGLG